MNSTRLRMLCALYSVIQSFLQAHQSIVNVGLLYWMDRRSCLFELIYLQIHVTALSIVSRIDSESMRWAMGYCTILSLIQWDYTIAVAAVQLHDVTLWASLFATVLAATSLKITTMLCYTRSAAVAVIADRTAYDVRRSYRPVSSIAVVSVSIDLFTVSNWSLLLMPVSLFSPFVAKRYILHVQQKCPKKWTRYNFQTLHRPWVPQYTSSQTDRRTYRRRYWNGACFLCSFKLAASGVTSATVFLPSLPGYRKTRKPSLGSWIRPALCGAGLECFRFWMN